MLKQGDVFQVGDEDQLYLVEAVTPSGAIYIRRFNLYTGAYGEPLTFQEKAELKVQFNDLQPEQAEGWEYCDIGHVMDWQNSEEWFAAEVIRDEGKVSVAASVSHSFIRGESSLTVAGDKTRKVHEKFVNKLLSQGWQNVPGRRRAWWHRRLKRKLGGQYPPESAEPERPGCLASLFGRRN